MIIIAGLGNPGEKYENTRHNIGFMIIDGFRGKNNFPGFKLNDKLNSLISKESIGQDKVILAKPQIFMNESGKALKKLVKNWKLEIGNLIVVHDDIDLLLGKIKISVGRGSAGHKGVESIIKQLRTDNFSRIRVGICPKSGKPENPEKFVLQKFSKNEQEIFRQTAENCADMLEVMIKNGVEKAMNEYNG